MSAPIDRQWSSKALSRCLERWHRAAPRFVFGLQSEARAVDSMLGPCTPLLNAPRPIASLWKR
eukprot:834767-Alexandrium_andersonii.AAC.1